MPKLIFVNKLEESKQTLSIIDTANKTVNVGANPCSECSFTMDPKKVFISDSGRIILIVRMFHRED